MGKRIIGVIAFAAIAAAAGWNYQQNKHEVKLSDLALENVEALARDEIICTNCQGFVMKTSGSCKICERGSGTCNIHDQEPC